MKNPFKIPGHKSVSFDYQIRRSKRAQKTRIIVTEAKVEVVAPPQVAERHIREFVHSQRDWVGAAIDKMRRHREKVVKMAPDVYRDGVRIPFRGDLYPLRIEPAALRRIKIEFSAEDGFVLRSPQPDAADHSEQVRNALTRWMKSRAREEGLRYIAEHNEKHRLMPRSLRIKTQKSRWGSCGVKDDIHINWLLVMAPPKVMEYVVVHELCHIRHRNHSRDFWDLVADHLPDYRQRRNWLKEHGRSLMLGL